MAIAFVQAVRGAVANNGTLSITPTNGNALVAFVFSETGSQHGSATDTTDSRAFAELVFNNDGVTGSGAMSVLLLTNVSGGAKTITIGTGASGAEVIVIEYSGGVQNIDAHSFNPQNSPGTTANAITSSTYTVGTGDLGVGWCAGLDVSVAQALVAGNGTSRNSGTIVNGGLNRWTVLQDSASTGSVSSTFTDATNGGTTVYETMGISLSTVSPMMPDDSDLTFFKVFEANSVFDEEAWEFVYDSRPVEPTFGGQFFNLESEF